jgi:DNA-binding NtrC family response regulator
MHHRADVSTRLHDLRPSQLTLQSGEILVVEGPDRGGRLALESLTVRVGTGEGCHLRLTDPTVSRLHFQLSPRGDGLRLTDVGSTNGTLVEGVRVRDADLLAGATVRIGASVLRVEFGREPLCVEVSRSERFGSLLGAGIEMRRLYTVLERAAPTQATVLIQGETGTGKELVARELHEHSRRKSGPFVAVDCGAIAPNVIESELFGHTRGAFSGAVSDRRGLIEEAHGGTLFLDEVGELPLSLQAKLLRALETREVRRVGANSARAVDIRLVAATNRMLAQSVNEGSFREDLYYRLAVVEVQLPPLRFRREDLPLLADHFYRRLSDGSGAIPTELVAALMTRSWPGNVRELRNFIERCVTLGITTRGPGSSGDEASSSERSPASSTDGPPPSRERLDATLPLNLSLPLKEARDDAMERLEHMYAQSVLSRSEGNVTRAAELAGVSRRFMQRLIARLGLREATSDSGGDEDDGDEG